MDSPLNSAWDLSRIAVVFLTCPREPSYLGQTLASFYAGDARAREFAGVTVAVDAEDLACVEWLRHHAGIRWAARSAEDSARIEGWHLHRRACGAYWRALGLGMTGARGLLVFEDDVVFRDGWVGMLLEMLEEMYEAGWAEFMVTLSSYREHESAALRRGRFFLRYEEEGFYGTQGMFYTASEVEPLREIIFERGMVRAEAPFDLLVKYQVQGRANFFASRVALIQHAGQVSTGLGANGLKNGTFAKPWPIKGKVAVLTSVSFDCALLPHFVRHYFAFGVRDFYISVAGIWEETAAAAAELEGALGVVIRLLPASPRQMASGVEGANKDELRRRVDEDVEWVIPADLDELVQFPAPLVDLILRMECEKAAVLCGRFVDRIAANGELAALSETGTIWEQYPLECDVSGGLAQALCAKVVLARRECELSSGHHFTIGDWPELRGLVVMVHHFKWRAGIREVLERRVAVYQRENVPWVGESVRVLDYLALHGRLVPEDFAGREGWRG